MPIEQPLFSVEAITRIAQGLALRDYRTVNFGQIDKNVPLVEVRMHNSTCQFHRVALWLSLWMQILGRPHDDFVTEEFSHRCRHDFRGRHRLATGRVVSGPSAVFRSRSKRGGIRTIFQTSGKWSHRAIRDAFHRQGDRVRLEKNIILVVDAQRKPATPAER